VQLGFLADADEGEEFRFVDRRQLDAEAAVVTECAEVKDPRRTADLKDAEKVLREEKARVDARYQEIVRTDKEKGASMDRRFKEFLEKSQGDTPSRPLRDVDLD